MRPANDRAAPPVGAILPWRGRRTIGLGSSSSTNSEGREEASVATLPACPTKPYLPAQPSSPASKAKQPSRSPRRLPSLPPQLPRIPAMVSPPAALLPHLLSIHISPVRAPPRFLVFVQAGQARAAPSPPRVSIPRRFICYLAV